MLLISTLAGMTHATQNGISNVGNLASNHSVPAEQTVMANPAKKRGNKNKGFKVSLFLFRLD